MNRAMLVNPYCADLGWLFEDLKRAFGDGLSWARSMDTWKSPFAVATSDEPLEKDADAYIALRSWEITKKTPYPERHVVQFHSLEPRFAGDPATLNRCAAFVFVHPDQPAMLERLGVSIDRPCLLRPIGAPAGLRLRRELPKVFTVGWCGRDTNQGSATQGKRVGLFTQAVNQLPRGEMPVRALMLGAQLDDAKRQIHAPCEVMVREPSQPYDLEQAQRFYDQLDVLVITSKLETGPMPLFEALACGVPIHAPIGGCGWTSRLPVLASESPPVIAKGFRSDTERAYAFGLEIAAREREQNFARRHLIRASLLGFTLEGWIEDNVRLAMEVARG